MPEAEQLDGDAQQCLPVIRSLNSLFPVNVVFRNRCPRTIKLLWIDYRGEPQSYGNLKPQNDKRMKTYESHPWMFRDTKTDDPMLVNGKEMYLPKALQNVNLSVVDITLPVFSLRERCLQVVRKLVRSEDFPRLEIGRCLQEDLAQRPNIHTDLQRINQQNREAQNT